ncbi:MAG: beta-ketoacyl synthase N-terminal-like domain-containing protein [Polyangiales bacterium]
MRPVAIARTAALSAFGAGARGLGRALANGAALPGLPAETPLANPRARKMMSPAAYLAARCLVDLLGDAGWREARDRIGYYLGVGASAGSLEDFMALLDESLVDGAYSLERFGHRGLAACNPLLAFQLMNNFTLCHGAILEGLGGPNSALFSRGAGTIAALGEAVYAVASGECDRAVTGGADAPTHPATVEELAREGLIGRGLVPADGAGLLALEVANAGDLVIEGCGVARGRGRPFVEAMDEAVAAARWSGPVDLVVVAPWGPPGADALRSWTAARCPGSAVVSTAALGESLAASAALAVIAAVDLLEPSQRGLVLSLGVDGDPGAVVLARGAA